MLPRIRFILTIDGNPVALGSDCIANWDELECCYKRDGHSGIMRSLSTGFDFVMDAYDLVRDEYLSKGVDAEAKLAVEVLNDKWSYDRMFEAVLDFSSITWDRGRCSVKCIDDSLAAMIKARKGTKYEFVVREDIPVDSRLSYDRVLMLNSASHTIIGANSLDNGNVMIQLFPEDPATSSRKVGAYELGSPERYENSPILSGDATIEGGYIIKAVMACTATLRTEFSSRTRFAFIDTGALAGRELSAINISLTRQNGAEQPQTFLRVFLFYTPEQVTPSSFKQVFDSVDALPLNPGGGKYARVKDHNGKEVVYITPKVYVDGVEQGDHELIQWEPGTASTMKVIAETTISLEEGEIVYPLARCTKGWTGYVINKVYYPVRGKITTTWGSRGEALVIDTLTPRDVAKALLDKVCDGAFDIAVEIKSGGFPSMTRIIAGESLRDFSTAKLYTTFKDFCGWMEAVFGYTYHIKEHYGPFHHCATFYGRLTNRTIRDEFLDNAHIVAFSSHFKRFAAVSGNAELYAHWSSERDYNDQYGQPRTDVIFKKTDNTLYRVVDSNLVEVAYYPGIYPERVNGDPGPEPREHYGIEFLHRSELFGDTEPTHIANATEVEYSVDSSLLYSTIEVGYNKQDYGKVCGRDEFNFANTYTTGSHITDKALSLKSPYRADCYGFEFLAQERSQSSKDNKSDNSVFFVECNSTDDDLLAIRRVSTLGTLSPNTVFNGQFAPLFCLENNKSYISAMKLPFTATFVSSEGNVNVNINGRSLKASATAGSRLFSAGTLSFESDQWIGEASVNGLVEIASDGTTYTGYISEVKMNFGKEAVYKYKLIVKDVTT